MSTKFRKRWLNESGVVNRYTWKYNKLHDPCQSEIYTGGLERRIRLGVEPYDRCRIVEGSSVITRSQSQFVRSYVVVFRLWICYQLGNVVDNTGVDCSYTVSAGRNVLVRSPALPSLCIYDL